VVNADGDWSHNLYGSGKSSRRSLTFEASNRRPTVAWCCLDHVVLDGGAGYQPRARAAAAYGGTKLNISNLDAGVWEDDVKVGPCCCPAKAGVDNSCCRSCLPSLDRSRRRSATMTGQVAPLGQPK